MQIPALDAVLSQPTNAANTVVLRILQGSLPSVSPAELITATVTAIGNGTATLQVLGQSVTVRSPVGLQVGDTFQARIAPGKTATLEVIDQSSGTFPLARVDVLSARPDGRWQVRIDGQDAIASSALPLKAGSRYILEVAQVPTGLIVRLPAQGAPPTEVATAMLRDAAPPEMGAALGKLLAELAPARAPVVLHEASANVRDLLTRMLPDGRTPNATEMRDFVENGGLHLEAKLDRAPGESDDPQLQGLAKSDLKAGLLRLLTSAHELGSSLAVPAARGALDRIESQQAANVIAQEQNQPFILQMPFLDGDRWQTLKLAIESEGSREPATENGGGSFRMLMHVPLSDLGETWIEAGLRDSRFRAVLYLDSADAREKVRAEIPALRDDLRTEGFSEVLLDVRSADALVLHQRHEFSALQAGRPATHSVLDERA